MSANKVSIASFEHGEHNEKACELLHLNGQYPDWVITTAFYASLHFVSSKIFPFNYSPKPGSPSVKFEDIASWQKFKNYASNKRHELIKDLVGEHCEKVASEYEWLLNSSWHARYHNHQHAPEIVNRARDYMQRIKKHCKP